MAIPKLPSTWSRWTERLIWVALAGVVLYRFVLPVPSAPLPPQAASARLAAEDGARVVEFSANR
jgi:hypothetical protein